MECTIRWAGPETMSFIAETGSGHSFVMDGAPEGGGRNLGPRPMEALLSGAAACTAYDVVLILLRSGMELTALETHATARRAEKDPKVFEEIEIEIQIKGKGLKNNLIEHAINLSQTKYCSAMKMLGMTAKITYSYRAVELT